MLVAPHILLYDDDRVTAVGLSWVVWNHAGANTTTYVAPSPVVASP
jgi:hypothetical protein